MFRQSVLILETYWPKGSIDGSKSQRSPNAVYKFTGSKGKNMLGVAANVLMPKSPAGLGVRLGFLVGAGMIGANLGNGVEVSATPDLASGEKEVTYNIIDYKKVTDLTFAVGETAVQAGVDGLKTAYKVKLPLLPDPRLPCKVNREMVGKATTHLAVPANAIETSLAVDGSTEVTIDPRQYHIFNGWGKYGLPDFKDYTWNSEGKNFEDKAGFCRDYIEYAASTAGVMQLNSLRNAVDKADAIVNEAMSQAALHELDTGSCLPSNVDELAVAAVEKLFTQLTKAQPDTKLGLVTVMRTDSSGTPIKAAYGPFTGKEATKLIDASKFSGKTGNTVWNTKNPTSKWVWDEATCDQGASLQSPKASETDGSTTGSPQK
jgi:hypothetical protein